MKKIALSLLVASMSLMAYDDFNGEEGDSTDSQVYVENQTVVNNVISNTPKTNLITSDKNYGVASELINAGDITILNIPVGMKVGYGFGIEANIPLVSVTDYGWKKEDNAGLGDISLGLNYNFGKLSDSTGLNISTVLYKTTTGDDQKGLGSGVSAVTLSHDFSKSLNEKYTVNALASYTLNDDTVLGNSYMLMAGGSMPCLISDKVKTSAKLTYFYVEDHTDSYGWTGGEVKSADLWLQWDTDKLIKTVPLGFGIKVPLLNQVDGNDADKTVLFYLSASSLF